MFSILKDLLRGNPQRRPNKPVSIEKMSMLPVEADKQTKVNWLGHSSVWLEIEGKRLLLDPTFADSPSPFPLIGGKRFNPVLPVEPERLPPIDAVVLSHDHYDHMDYKSIMRVKDKTHLFCVPNGVGKRLKKWGIDPAKIKEFAWWDELSIAGLKLVCTPARHFSGRGLLDRNTTLWCSWAILGQQSKVFFSGDGGYGRHFKQIGLKYGPFDLTLMECGQYDVRWAAIHMMPEETIQAHIDVKGDKLMLVHWATFSLAFHDWADPIERAVKAARERGVDIITPKIGEQVIVGLTEYPFTAWWK